LHQPSTDTPALTEGIDADIIERSLNTTQPMVEAHKTNDVLLSQSYKELASLNRFSEHGPW
jgi:hypothetical protein